MFLPEGVRPPIIAIVGPTATGKTAAAFALADAAVQLGFTGAEIVNADAFQLYRGMDIGTAKPTAQEQARYPHHQLDVLEIHDDASVAAYQWQARADIEAIQARGALPLLVGGSGLYLRAVLDDMRFPGTDPAVRARIETECAAIGAEAAHARLAAVDAPAAAAIEPRNLRRIVRALEVIELTGQRFSANLPRYQYVQPASLQLGIRWEADALEERIRERTDQMLRAGFVEEVRELTAHGLGQTKTAGKATGYPQVAKYLAGACGWDEMREAIVVATRQLAARQRKWFRRDPRINWVEPQDVPLLPEKVAAWLRDGAQ